MRQDHLRSVYIHFRHEDEHIATSTTANTTSPANADLYITDLCSKLKAVPWND